MITRESQLTFKGQSDEYVATMFETARGLAGSQIWNAETEQSGKIVSSHLKDGVVFIRSNWKE